MDIFTSIGSTIQTIASSFYSKLALLACTVLTAFFTPIAGLIFACFILNLADLIAGLEVAHKLGKTLWSRKTWTGTIKKIRQESLVIVLVHVIEHFALSAITSTTFLSGGVTVLICLTEAWSVLENLNTINPDGPWKMLGGLLRKKGSELAGVNIIVTRDGKLDVETKTHHGFDD